MKKFFLFCNKYKIFLLFCIPFIFVSIFNKTPNNDIWFLLSLGRHVVNSGIPTIDPLTIHEGLEYVMQQWMSASIYWSLFNTFGKFAVLGIVYILFFSLMILFYKLCKNVNGNRTISVVITTITFTIISTFMVNRPHMFTYFILLFEVFLLEKYISSNNYKWLFGLPILSVLLINLHSSMWYFQFIFLLPFIVNGIHIKNITIDKYKLKPILISALFMVLGGLINPYGIDAMTFIFKSYGVDIINEYVTEMAAPSLTGDYSYYFYIAIVLIFLLILGERYLKRFKLDVRHVCFILGTCFLYFSHVKCFPYFILMFMYAISYGFRKVKIPKFKSDKKIFKYIKSLSNGLLTGTLLMLGITFFVVLSLMIKSYNFSSTLSFNDDEDEIADFILENYDKDKVRLYCTYNEGGYYEYRELKVYIDGKAELFLKANNGKADILEEAIEVEEDKIDYDYKSFVDKYNFTHLIINDGSYFKKYLDTDERYEIVYTSNFNGEDGNPYRYVYALVE